MLKFNIQITLKSDEKIISKIWAVVDDYWYDGTLCLSDDVIASISSGEDLLNALYQFCFPRGDKKYMLTDSDFTVRDKNGIQDYKKIFLSLKDLSAVQEIIIKARYEEYGFSCSDSYEINNMNCPYIFDGSLTLKSKQIPETEREKEIVGIEELELSPCDFRALRLITKNKIYILYTEIDNGKWDIVMAPDDYMPELINNSLIWGENKLHTVSDLMAALWFVLSDSIDFEPLKITFCLLAKAIDANEAINAYLKYHTTENAKFIPNSTIDDLKKILGTGASKDKILNCMYSCFKTYEPNFSQLIENFSKVVKEVKELQEIEFVDVCEGFLGEDNLADEELYYSHRLDFSELL